ncbi:MAG: DoxX family protein [Ignavibacteria bacterium]|nr:DoxX family protein [Ignavibacteria bacterium]MCC7158899.1 DoxX family protein [Ignavibacteria bacterium]
MLKPVAQKYNNIDKAITHWMSEYGIRILRISLGIVFLWFGFLKFFPGSSPAEKLATNTITILTFGLVKPSVSIYLLATMETLIGLGLIFRIFLRATLFILFFQMLGTITPLFLFPGDTFTIIPFAPTLEGQYIIKNIVLLSAGIVIGSTVRRQSEKE